MTKDQRAQRAQVIRDDGWRDFYIDKRGCGGCTVRQFEAMQQRAIAERFDLSKDTVTRVLRGLTAEDRSAREDNFLVAAARRRSTQLARAITRPRAINPAADPLYAEIAKSVPRGIDPALRDDMISQAYLEVLEGRLDRTRLSEGVKKVRGRMFRTFANPWGNRSIDAPISDDGPETWADRIPDERSLEAFEAIR